LSPKQFLLLASILLLSGASLAQKRTTKKVKGVIGVSYLTESQTLQQAKDQALQDAKEKALLEAGVVEDINTIQLLQTSEENEVFTQSFNELILSRINGGIEDYTIVEDYQKDVDEFGEISITVTINAKVVLYKTKSDPRFTAKIENLKSVYENGELLKFSLVPTKKSF